MIVNVCASASLCVLGLFVFLDICLFCPIQGCLFYFILFYCYSLSVLDASSFLMREIPKDVYFGVRVDGEDLAESGEGGTII